MDNQIVYHCLTREPFQALLFGNGPIGGAVYTPDDSLYLNISRGDLWNAQGNMGALAGIRIQGEQGVFTAASSVHQVCDMARAEIRVTLETVGGQVTFTVTCLREQEMIVVDVDDSRAVPAEFTLTLEDWHPDARQSTGPEGTQETLTVVGESVFAARNRQVEVDAGALGLPDPMTGRSWGLFARAVPGPGHTQTWCLAALCRPPRLEAEDLLRTEAYELLASAPNELAAWRQAHADFWQKFWERSLVRLRSGTGDAEYSERLWHATLYAIACGSGGAYPLRFNGGAYLLDDDTRAWDGGYWFQNMREVYWPLFASGHEKFAQDFFGMYRNAQAFVRAQTGARYGLEGLCYRETQTFWGLDSDGDLDNLTPGMCDYLSNNLELCLLMEWYWRRTGDDQFLRETLYPILREVLTFFRGYAKRGADGLFHLEPVTALESLHPVKDDMPDLCGLHYFLPRALEWGRAMREAEETLNGWQEFLDNLPPLPVGRWTMTRQFQDGIQAEEYAIAAHTDPDGIFLPAAGLGAERVRRGNMENAELYVIFPWGLVGRDSPPSEVRRAENTWSHRTWRYLNNGWGQDTLQIARMGWADQAYHSLKTHASYAQRFPSGGFISPAGPHFMGALTSTPFFDSAGVHAASVNEMLLQSYDGILRICPATPDDWSGAFRLYALDGFQVDADFSQGQPTRVEICAERAGLLRIRNDRLETLLCGTSPTLPGEILVRQMAVGKTLEIRWDGVTVDSNDDVPPEIVYPGCRVRLPLVAHRSGHWHDEGWGHGQVGLFADGLFPATRPERRKTNP